jgi:penicillin-binding protein 1A
MKSDKSNKKPSYLGYVIVFWVIYAGISGVLTGYFYALSEDWLFKLPSFEELENPKSNLATEIYTSDNKLLGKYFRENRTNVHFENIPEHTWKALIATEDERFFEHSGIDIRGTFRAVVYLGSKGGASTITQQLAKLLFHEPAQNIAERIGQKTLEWVIATKLERQYTKEEIITMYLNKFDFVNNAVGIESAAQVYFNSTTDSLNLLQSAMLVGMAKNPALFNPVRRPDTTLTRRNVVLSQMIRSKFITQLEFDSLKTVPLELNFKRVDHTQGSAPYFREVLRNELRNLFAQKDAKGNLIYSKADGSPYSIYSDGLRVYTTLDSRMQEYAEYAVNQHLGGELQKDFWNDISKYKNPPFSNNLNENQINGIIQRSIKLSDRYRDYKAINMPSDSIEWHFKQPIEMSIFSWQGEIDTVMSPLDSIFYHKSFLHAGLMSMDPRTGEVKAWVGGINHKFFAYDHVKQGARQVGSTFKPFVYALAIENGLSPCKEVPNIPVTFKKGTMNLLQDWTPKNSGKEHVGEMVTLKYGLANSYNNITAWVMKQYGPAAVISYARRMGITSNLDTVPSLCLGVADITLFEMVGANSTFASKGIYKKPIFISRIEDKNGAVIIEFQSEMSEAMSEENAYAMIELMKGVTMGAKGPDGKRTGTGVRLHSNRPYANIPWDRAVAGKTGTTQNNSDGWFMGITPDLVTGVWVGAEDRGVHFRTTYFGQGANTALPIWGYYMNKVWADNSLDVSTRDFEKPETVKVEFNCDLYKKANAGNDFNDVNDFDFND